jgi:hypothetical protein
VWAPDLIIGDGTPALEAVVTVATAAAVTERINVGSVGGGGVGGCGR